MATMAGSTLRRGAASLPHQVVYTLLFAFVALAVMDFAVPVMRQYSGEHEQIIGEALLLVLLIEVTSSWLHRFVDWLLYGHRGDAAVVSWRLSRELESVDARSAVPNLVAALAESLRLSYVEAIAAEGADGLPLARFGTPPSRLTRFPIRHAGVELGELHAGRRGEQLNRQDERLLAATAAQLGLLLHASTLTAQLQSARERLVASREDERRRLRRELHDGIGPALAGIALGLESAERLAGHGRTPDQSQRLATLLGDVRSEATSMISDVRRVVEGLRPPLLDELGLAASLDRLGRALGDRSGLRVTVRQDGAVPLPAAVEVAVYRVAAEALTNVARHARAAACSVELSTIGPQVRLVVSDDGCGTAAPGTAGTASTAGTVSTDPHGSGMTTMRERVEELGGTLTVSSSASGSVVQALIPAAGTVGVG
jgi:signal transduction histidine kinase